jgi:hypothetical protein
MKSFRDPISIDDEKLLDSINHGKDFEEVKGAIHFYCGSYQIMRYTLLAFKPHKEWFEFFGESWESSDNVFLYMQEIKTIFKAHNSLTHYMMDQEDLQVFNDLPQTVEVFRGQCADKPTGLSWTLNKDIALKFASGEMDRYLRVNPVLLTAKINKSDIYAIKTGRGEKEVICSPKRHKRVYAGGG